MSTQAPKSSTPFFRALKCTPTLFISWEGALSSFVASAILRVCALGTCFLLSCVAEEDNAQPSLLLAQEAPREAEAPCELRRRVYLFQWHGQHACGWVGAYFGTAPAVEISFHGRLPVRLESEAHSLADRDTVYLATLGVYGLPLTETASAGEVALAGWPSESLDEIRDPESGWLVGAWLPTRQLTIDWVTSECLDDRTPRSKLNWSTFARALALRAVNKSESCRRSLYQSVTPVR